MKLLACLAAAAGVLTAVVADGSVNSDPSNATDDTLAVRQNGCNRGVHIIALGGQQTTDGDLGLLAPLAFSIRDSIRNSDLSQIAYPPGSGGGDAIANAVPRLQAHLREYVAACPNSKIVLAGYSIGATVIMNTLCGASATGENSLPSSPFRRNIIANILYGDLTYVSGPSYTVGSCTGRGRVPRQFPGRCFPFGRVTQSYCDAPDPECCSGPDPNEHFTYPAKYDQQALNYVIGRVNS